MKKAYYIPFLCACLILILPSCHRERNARDFAVLWRLDSIAEIEPKIAEDTLKMFNIKHLSRYNRGYYQLVDAIIKDKNYFPFTSDSLIMDAVRLLKRKKGERPFPYARALMYSGVVRYRMGITDSTAYNPMKDALKIMEKETPRAVRNLSLIAQYLGVIHDANDNMAQAYRYFKKSLTYAKQINKVDYMFYDYLELVWNRLKTNNLPQAKLYLDTLKNYTYLSESNKVGYENVMAVYYYYNKEYKKALELDHVLEKQVHLLAPDELYKFYYRLSDSYKALQDYKNAYHYMQLAIQQADTTQYLNYILYINAGELAEKAHYTQEAAKAYRAAYDLLDKSIEKQLDKKILELEKKYDYTEVENKKLIVENRLYLITVASVFIILVLFIFLLWNLRSKAQKEKRLLITASENLKLKLEHEKSEYENQRKKWSNELYQYIAKQQAEAQRLLYKISISKGIKADEKLTLLIANEMKNYSKEQQNITNRLVHTDNFFTISGLDKEKENLLNDNEKILLSLLCCGLTHAEIASMISSTPESVRVRTVKLSQKLTELKIKTNLQLPYIL